MDVITLDLDDTLILTQPDYGAARSWFGEFVNLRYDVAEETARETQREASRELLDEYELSRFRFPTSMRVALQRLTENPSEDHLERAEEIGWSVYKDVGVYEEHGFRDGGDALIEAAQDVGDTVALLTAGDPVVQETKIEALGLRERLDDIRIVGMGQKERVLSEYRTSAEGAVLHVGNSSSSDVGAAAAADVDCLYIPDGEWLSDDPDGVEAYTGSGTCLTASSPAAGAELLREHADTQQ